MRIIETVPVYQRVYGTRGKIYTGKVRHAGSRWAGKSISFYSGSVGVGYVNTIGRKIPELVVCYPVIHRACSVLASYSLSVYSHAVIAAVKNVILKRGIIGIVTGCIRVRTSSEQNPDHV